MRLRRNRNPLAPRDNIYPSSFSVPNCPPQSSLRARGFLLAAPSLSFDPVDGERQGELRDFTVQMGDYYALLLCAPSVSIFSLYRPCFFSASCALSADFPRLPSRPVPLCQQLMRCNTSSLEEVFLLLFPHLPPPLTSREIVGPSFSPDCRWRVNYCQLCFWFPFLFPFSSLPLHRTPVFEQAPSGESLTIESFRSLLIPVICGHGLAVQR